MKKKLSTVIITMVMVLSIGTITYAARSESIMPRTYNTWCVVAAHPGSVDTKSYSFTCGPTPNCKVYADTVDQPVKVTSLRAKSITMTTPGIYTLKLNDGVKEFDNVTLTYSIKATLYAGAIGEGRMSY